jgi:hypothetical protein
LPDEIREKAREAEPEKRKFRELYVKVRSGSHFIITNVGA